MSSDDVNGASMTQSLHLHLGLAPNQGDSEEESEDDDKGDDSIATFNVKWQIQNGEVRLPVVLFVLLIAISVGTFSLAPCRVLFSFLRSS